MSETKILTVEEELAQVEAQIVETKEHLAQLKEKRRKLYAHQADRNREAMARAAASLGMDYDAFLAQVNRYRKQNL